MVKVRNLKMSLKVRKNNMETRWIQIFAPVALILLVVLPPLWQKGTDEDLQTGSASAQGSLTDPFLQILIQAKAAYVYDARAEKVLYDKNAELQFPLASVTKIMTAVVAVEMNTAAVGITINDDTISPEGDSGFRVGEKWDIKDMIDLTLVSSSNDGARALAGVATAFPNESGLVSEERFIVAMNEKARVLGLTQTFFLNESGLDTSAGVSGAYGSARDIAFLLSYVLHEHPNLMEATMYKSISVLSSDGTHTAENTNKALDKIPGIIASKTGFTDLAGGNLAVAFEAGPLRPIIIVVLGSTEDGRFDDVATLAQSALSAIAR